MRGLRILAKVLGALALLALAVLFAPRLFLDGPLGPIPGGPLRAGEVFAFPVSDWSFAAHAPTIEMQLASQRISRTTGILVIAGAAYVPCNVDAPPGKSWYRLAQQDGRAVLRIEGKRYGVTLTRDDDATLAELARAEVRRKYGSAPSSAAQMLLFRVRSRALVDE